MMKNWRKLRFDLDALFMHLKSGTLVSVELDLSSGGRQEGLRLSLGSGRKS
jgi:hypothetical protein